MARYQGVDYLAVNPSTGQVPPASRSLIPSYGSTFPASPVDGQEHIYTAGANGECWRFRYNAGSSSAYKWEYIGGAEVVLAATASIPAARAPSTSTS